MLQRQRQFSDQIADGQRLAVAQCGKPLGLFTRKPGQHGRQSVDDVGPQALEGVGITRLDVQPEPDHGLSRVNVGTDINRKGIDIHSAPHRASGSGTYSNTHDDNPQVFALRARGWVLAAFTKAAAPGAI
mgnify:CR=1 FL=1